MENKLNIAKALLSIKAVFLRPNEPFIWASGIRSPIYCDNRLILSAPHVRNLVENSLADTVRRSFPETQMLAGTATAGIPHAAITAHLLGLPMCYVRSGAKDHGRKNQIEGRLEVGQKVLVVEDLISTGGSVIETARKLAEVQADVLGIISIFTYGMQKSKENLLCAGLRAESLTDLDAVLLVGVDEGYITLEEAAKIRAFRDDPTNESWIGGKS